MGIDGFTRYFYSIEAQLDGGITGNSLVGSKVENVGIYNVSRLRITNEDLTGFDLDFFIPVIPTGELDDSWADLTFTVFFDDGSEDLLRGPDLSININDELSFLRTGFKAGKSYYFNIDVANFVGD